MLKAFALGLALAALLASAISAQEAGANRPGGQVLKGKSALGDWRQDKPGLRRQLTLQDVPPIGKSTPNFSEIARMPSNAKPEVFQDFSVELVVSRLGAPRVIRRAPNGDLFIAETSANKVRLLRVPSGSAKPNNNEVLASGMSKPYGIAFHPLGDNPQWVYVANDEQLLAVARESNIAGVVMHPRYSTDDLLR